MNEYGLGAKGDIEEAAKWYLLAAAQGNDYSKRRLERNAQMQAVAEKVKARNLNSATSPAPAVQTQILPSATQVGAANSVPQPQIISPQEPIKIVPVAQEATIAFPKPEELKPQSQVVDSAIVANRRALVIGNDSYKNV